MTTFDGWDARYCGDALALPGDVLAHWRTKGSKNGVRRYQQPDGTWTPLGLRERRAREGWGESRKERRAEKKVARAEKKAAKAEARAAASARRSEARKESLIRNKRKTDMSDLSDEELKRKIDRVRLESEYKDLTRSQLSKTGEKLLTTLVENYGKKEDRKLAQARVAVDQARANADLVRAKTEVLRAREDRLKAKEQRKQAKEIARQKEADAETAKQERKGGIKYERKARLKDAKRELHESRFLGGFWKVHKAKRMAEIEDKKAMNQASRWVRNLINTQREIDKYNAYEYNSIWKGGGKRTKITWTPEKYEGQNAERKSYKNAKAQETLARLNVEKARFNAKEASANAQAAFYSSQKGNKKGKPKKK